MVDQFSFISRGIYLHFSLSESINVFNPYSLLKLHNVIVLSALFSKTGTYTKILMKLDDLYIQLHEYWIVEGMIIYGAVTIYELQETSWILSWIFGFGCYLFFLLASFHLLVCLIFRIILIFSHSTFEEIEDKYIL